MSQGPPRPSWEQSPQSEDEKKLSETIRNLGGSNATEVSLRSTNESIESKTTTESLEFSSFLTPIPSRRFKTQAFTSVKKKREKKFVELVKKQVEIHNEFTKRLTLKNQQIKQLTGVITRYQAAQAEEGCSVVSLILVLALVLLNVGLVATFLNHSDWKTTEKFPFIAIRPVTPVNDDHDGMLSHRYDECLAERTRLDSRIIELETLVHQLQSGEQRSSVSNDLLDERDCPPQKECPSFEANCPECNCESCPSTNDEADTKQCPPCDFTEDMCPSCDVNPKDCPECAQCPECTQCPECPASTDGSTQDVEFSVGERQDNLENAEFYLKMVDNCKAALTASNQRTEEFMDKIAELEDEVSEVKVQTTNRDCPPHGTTGSDAVDCDCGLLSLNQQELERRLVNVSSATEDALMYLEAFRYAIPGLGDSSFHASSLSLLSALGKVFGVAIGNMLFVSYFFPRNSPFLGLVIVLGWTAVAVLCFASSLWSLFCLCLGNSFVSLLYVADPNLASSLRIVTYKRSV